MNYRGTIGFDTLPPFSILAEITGFFSAPRYPEEFFHALPEFDRPETAVLPLPRLYLQAKQLAQDLAAAERDGEVVPAAPLKSGVGRENGRG